MACGNSRPECLQTGLWKQPRRSSSGRVQVLLRGHTGQRQNPAQPMPLANLAQIFLASTGTAHEGEGCWRCVQTCPCPSQAQTR